MADQLNVLFETHRLDARLDEFQDLYQPEIAKHQCKWYECFDAWEDNIGKMQNFIGGRAGAVRTNFVNQYNEISDTTAVSITANPIDGGRIEFSSLTLDQDYFPWKGIYFAGIDIPVKAIPADGYEFVGWSDSALGSNAEGTVNITSKTYDLTANFQLIVGLDELAQNTNITISPNPTSDIIRIQSTLLEGLAVDLHIIDMEGRVVFYKEVKSFPQGAYTINAGRFPKGAYTVKLDNGQGEKITTSVILE